MKLRENCDLPAFLQAVDRCAGEVTFETEDGDILNLKSQLSKYIFLAAAASPSISVLPSGVVKWTDDTDGLLLTEYLRP